MQVTIWVVNTCCPGETEPCLPSVFGTEAEAEKYLDQMMRAEWTANGPKDDDDEPLPYPGIEEATEKIKAERVGDELWGEWEITQHTVEVPAA
jgi:hypothetical protein